jgi:hypothetical protein
VAGSAEEILEVLKWCKIGPDEGFGVPSLPAQESLGKDKYKYDMYTFDKCTCPYECISISISVSISASV